MCAKLLNEKENEGVSAVIAVILMVAITVVLAGVLYAWVMGMHPPDGKNVSVATRLSKTGNNVTLEVISTTGDVMVRDIKVLVQRGTVIQKSADFGTLSGANGTLGEGEYYQLGSFFILDNDRNTKLNANDYIWITEGAQSGDEIVLMISGEKALAKTVP